MLNTCTPQQVPKLTSKKDSVFGEGQLPAWFGAGHLSSVKHDTDLDTCCDTEDITVRCNVSLPFSGGIKFTANVSTDKGVTPVEVNKLSDLKNYTDESSSLKIVKEFNGGVIGMHYVRHGSNYFKAITSKNIPSDMISMIKSKYTLSYR